MPVQVIQHWSSIQTSPVAARLATGRPNPDFCERGTWKLMVAVTVIYSIVLLFRVVTVIGSLVTDRKRKEAVREGGGGEDEETEGASLEEVVETAGREVVRNGQLWSTGELNCREGRV